MSKLKSAIITTLLVVAVSVLAFFGIVSFTYNNGINTQNSFLSSIKLGGEFSGYAQAVLYPEGVISASEYNRGMPTDADEKETYEAKYTACGGVYVETSKIATEAAEQEFVSSIATDAEIISARLGEKGYSSYNVAVENLYTIRVALATGVTYAEAAQNTVSIYEAQYAINYASMSGEFSLRYASDTLGSSINDPYETGTNSFTKLGEDVNSYFKSFEYYAMGGGHGVQINLTPAGRDFIKNWTSQLAAQSSDKNMLFYVGADSVLTLTCESTIDMDSFIISVNDPSNVSAESLAKNYAITLNSALNNKTLANDYNRVNGNKSIAIEYYALPSGNLGAVLVACAFALALVGAAVFFIVKYKKLGWVNAISVYFYAVAMLTALFVIGVELTFAGVMTIVLGLGMLLASNYYTFEAVRAETKTGKTIQSSIKSGYQKTVFGVLDLHVVLLIASAVLALVGMGAVSACGVILFVATIASYVLYWFTRWMWYVNSAPAKDKFAFGGYTREVYEDD